MCLVWPDHAPARRVSAGGPPTFLDSWDVPGLPAALRTKHSLTQVSILSRSASNQLLRERCELVHPERLESNHRAEIPYLTDQSLIELIVTGHNGNWRHAMPWLRSQRAKKLQTVHHRHPEVHQDGVRGCATASRKASGALTALRTVNPAIWRILAYISAVGSSCSMIRIVAGDASSDRSARSPIYRDSTASASERRPRTT